MPKFATTPILELPDGTWEPCCESCADKEFPGGGDDQDESHNEIDIEEEMRKFTEGFSYRKKGDNEIHNLP